jgi:hypothetical protein
MDFSTDIPRTIAYQAHAGTSMVPDERATQEIAGYVATLTQDLENMAKHADTPAKREILEELFANYRAGYRKRYLAHLGSRGRCMSAMITGPSNFPIRRNQKRNATADNRLSDLLEFRTKTLDKIRKILHPELRPVMAGDDDATERLTKKIESAKQLQKIMKDCNAAIRKNKKHGTNAQISALKNLGRSESQARTLLEPDFAGRIGFPSYALTNNNANIRRMVGRLEKIKRDKGAVDTHTEGEHARVEDCPADNRIRLFFPDKPAVDIRNRLKSSGFRWAPSLGCWQAYRNSHATATANEVAGA